MSDCPDKRSGKETSSTELMFMTESIKHLRKDMAKMKKDATKTRIAMSKFIKEEEKWRTHSEESMVKLGDMISTIGTYLGADTSTFPTIGVRPTPSDCDSPSLDMTSDDQKAGTEGRGSSRPKY